MADNSVFIAGAAEGSFLKAFEGLPPWATEVTAKKIEEYLRKTLAIQTSVLSELAKSVGGKGKPLDTDKVSDALTKLEKELDDSHKKGTKRNKEEEKEFKDKQKRWRREKDADNARFDYSNIIIQLGLKTRQAFVDNINVYDTLIAAGINVVNGFNDVSDGLNALRQVAVLTGVRYTELVESMVKYNTAVNVFGVNKFAKTIGMASRELYKFGFTNKESADLLGSYLEVQLGMAATMHKTQSEANEDLIKFGNNVFRLSMVTGMARAAILSNLEAISKTTEATVLQGQIGTDAAESTLQFIASIKDQNIGRAFLRMMTDSIKPLNQTFSSFQKIGLGSFGQKLLAFNQQLRGMSPERAAQAVKAFEAQNSEEIKFATKQANFYRQVPDLAADAESSLGALVSITQVAKSVVDKLSEAEIAKLEKTNEATKTLKSQWERLLSSFQQLLSPSIDMLNKLSKGLEWVNEQVTAFGKNMNETDRVIAAWVGLATIVGGVILSLKLFKGALNFVRNRGIAEGASKKWTTSLGASGAGGRVKGPSILSNMGKGIKSFVDGLSDSLTKFSNGVKNLLTNIGTGIGGFLQGLLTGTAKGLSAFAAPSVLIGAFNFAAAIGLIGAAVAGATWMIGAALPKFAEGIKAFGGINGDNLLSVAKGIGALGLSMAVFAAGNLTTSFTNIFSSIANTFSKLFGEGSLIDQLKGLSGLGAGLKTTADAFTSITNSISALSMSLSKFSGLDTLKAIISTINSLNVDKVVAFSLLARPSSVSLPNPTPLNSTNDKMTFPRASTINSPSQVSASTEKVGQQALPKEQSKPLGAGIEKPTSESSINTMIGYQSAILEQILLSTNNLVSVNRDILKYARVNA